MKRARVFVALTFGAALGCNALLGLSDPVDEPGSGDGSQGDGADVNVNGDAVSGFDACASDGGTLDDPHNCGACGHDCQGGDCVGGACQPLALASAGGRISSIVTYGPILYWSEVYPDAGGAVKAMNALDAGGAKTLVPSAPGPSWLRRFGGDIYFATSNDMIQLLSGGVPPSVLIVSRAGCGMQGIAVDSENVRFSCSKAGEIDAVLRTGGASAAPLYSVPAPIGAAVVGGRVYWDSSGHIQSAPADGGGFPDTIAPAIITTEPILLTDGFDIFWIQESSAIESAPLSGTLTPTIVGQSVEAVDLTLDSNNVYWTDDQGAGGIYHAPKAGQDGGVPYPIDARFLALPGPIAVDNTSVYWGNQDGRLMKYALP